MEKWSCWFVHIAFAAVLSASNVPISRTNQKASENNVPSNFVDFSTLVNHESDLNQFKAEVEESFANCSLCYENSFGHEVNLKLRSKSVRLILRGGTNEDDGPRLFGIKIPRCTYAWAVGLGLSFKHPKPKVSSVAERPRKILLSNPEKAIMLQGFDWASMPDKQKLYKKLVQEMPSISDSGINVVWFPPPSSSADPHGYMPGRWYEIPLKSQLLEATEAARLHGVVSMVDVVLNHRTGTRVSQTTGDWTSFEAPDWEEWAVVRDDWKCPPDEAKAFCPHNVTTCGAADTGENACFAPDLDHTHPRVQADVAAWLAWLGEALGFRALRFDNTKGYAPEAVARYVAAARPVLSVGEFFDTNRQLLTGWLARAGPGVGTFDFGLRYKLKDAVATDDFSPLRDAYFGPMLHYAPDRAVTFLDNHDTAGDLHDRFGPPAALEQGYAFLLTHPGVPCVFWADWLGPARPVIQQLAGLRAAANLTRSSRWDLREAGPGLYAAVVGGGEAGVGALAVKLGSRDWSPNRGLPARAWQAAASGPGWAVWTPLLPPPP